MPELSPAKPQALQSRSRDTEQRILQAALAILGESGAEALTTPKVSAAAGVSVGTIYRRFGNKEELLRSTQQEFLRLFRDRLFTRFASRSPKDAADPARTVIHATKAMGETFHEFEAPLRQLLLLGLRNPVVYADGQKASIEGGQAFDELILEHRAKIPHPDPDAAVDFVYRLTYAACSHRLLQGESLESPLRRTWKGMLDELGHANQAYLLTPPAHAHAESQPDTPLLG